MKFEKIEEGMTLYSVERRCMGNTTMRTTAIFPVRVISLNSAKRKAMVSWNGNPAREMGEKDLKKLRATKPETVRNAVGGIRLATRAERLELATKRKGT